MLSNLELITNLSSVKGENEEEKNLLFPGIFGIDQPPHPSILGGRSFDAATATTLTKILLINCILIIFFHYKGLYTTAVVDSAMVFKTPETILDRQAFAVRHVKYHTTY